MNSDESPSPHQLDRQRGILSEADRQFLAGEKDLTEQSKRDARYRIRNRIKHGILDLSILPLILDENDRRSVGKSIFSNDDRGDVILRDCLNFQYLLVMDSVGNDIGKTNDRLEDILLSILERHARDVHEEKMIEVDVELKVNVNEPNVENVLEKYEIGDETREELEYLRDVGAIDTDERFWRHLLRHYFAEGEVFRIVVPDEGFYEADPEEYSVKEEFVNEALEYRATAKERYDEMSEDG